MDNVELGWMQIMSKLWLALSSMGTVGLIIAGVLSVAIIYFMIRYKKMKNAAAQAATEKKRDEALAANPVQNKKDEDDMKAGEDAINKMINGGQ